MIIKIILATLIAPIILLNMFGPIITKRTQKIPARFKIIKHDEKEFLLGRDKEFHALNSEIRALGFKYIGSSFIENGQVETSFSLYSNEADLSCAMLVSIESPVKLITYVEFTQMYADGFMLDVCNVNQVSAYPKMDIKLMARYPHIQAPKELYAIFRSLRQTHQHASKPIAVDPNKGFQLVAEHLAKEADILVENGYCKPEIDQEGKRSLTWKGACLMTWVGVFPGNRLKNKMEITYAKKLLASA